MLMPWSFAFCLGFVGVLFVKSLFFSLFFFFLFFAMKDTMYKAWMSKGIIVKDQ